MRCFYFGCWNQPGHYIRESPKNPPRPPDTTYDQRHQIEYYGDHVHLDSTLAPRCTTQSKMVWAGQGKTREERNQLIHKSFECDQGQFLHHHLDNGYTAIQWWDRTQGDTRGACNSTVLLEGRHTADEMVAALAEHFPSVLANLTKAGVTLQEVHP